MLRSMYHKAGCFWVILKTLLYAVLLRKRKSACIYMMNIPEHRNMGDQAIVLAEKSFFSVYFPEILYVGLTSRQWDLCKGMIKKMVKKEDLICIHGGGYIGDLWPGAERVAKEIIRAFPHNRVVLMPNTVYFYSGQSVKQLLFYRKRNVCVFLRDQRSYQMAVEAGLTNCSLVPDTVAFLDKYQKKKRRGVLFCLRKDKERVLSEELCRDVSKMLAIEGICCHFTDMLTGHGVRTWNRFIRVERKMNEFRKAGVVVTDRLHGMYFCAVTGTPCIALNNLSKKVEGGYQWLQSLEYIRLVREPSSENIYAAVKQLLFSYTERKPDRPARVLKKYFDKEAEIIRTFRKSVGKSNDHSNIKKNQSYAVETPEDPYF